MSFVLIHCFPLCDVKGGGGGLELASVPKSVWRCPFSCNIGLLICSHLGKPLIHINFVIFYFRTHVDHRQCGQTLT